MCVCLYVCMCVCMHLSLFMARPRRGSARDAVGCVAVAVRALKAPARSVSLGRDVLDYSTENTGQVRTARALLEAAAAMRRFPPTHPLCAPDLTARLRWHVDGGGCCTGRRHPATAHRGDVRRCGVIRNLMMTSLTLLARRRREMGLTLRKTNLVLGTEGGGPWASERMAMEGVAEKAPGATGAVKRFVFRDVGTTVAGGAQQWRVVGGGEWWWWWWWWTRWWWRRRWWRYRKWRQRQWQRGPMAARHRWRRPREAPAARQRSRGRGGRGRARDGRARVGRGRDPAAARARCARPARPRPAAHARAVPAARRGPQHAPDAPEVSGRPRRSLLAAHASSLLLLLSCCCCCC